MRVKSFFGVIFNVHCLSCVCHQDLGAIAVVSAATFSLSSCAAFKLRPSSCLKWTIQKYLWARQCMRDMDVPRKSTETSRWETPWTWTKSTCSWVGRLAQHTLQQVWRRASKTFGVASYFIVWNMSSYAAPPLSAWKRQRHDSQRPQTGAWQDHRSAQVVQLQGDCCHPQYRRPRYPTEPGEALLGGSASQQIGQDKGPFQISKPRYYAKTETVPCAQVPAGKRTLGKGARHGQGIETEDWHCQTREVGGWSCHGHWSYDAICERHEWSQSMLDKNEAQLSKISFFCWCAWDVWSMLILGAMVE